MTERRQVLDDVAKAIIAQLQVDGRRSYAAIAKAVGLSEAAVRQRVQRLTESGVIQIVAVTDPIEVGFGRQAMIGVTVDGGVDAVAEKIEKIDAVDYLVVTAGRFDLLVEIVCEDDEHLLEVVADQVRGVPGVQTTETFIYLDLRKQTYAWGAK